MMETTVREKRREEILAAAALEFREWGFERTKMEEIARRAGIGKSTVYEYFPSKSELLIEVLSEGLASMNRTMGEFLSRPVPFREKLAALLGRAGTMLRESLLPLVAMRDCAPALEFMRTHGDLERDYLTGLLEKCIEQAAQNGEIRADLQPRFVANLALALIMSAGHGTLASGAATLETMHGAVDLLFEGIAPSAEKPQIACANVASL